MTITSILVVYLSAYYSAVLTLCTEITLKTRRSHFLEVLQCFSLFSLKLCFVFFFYFDNDLVDVCCQGKDNSLTVLNCKHGNVHHEQQTPKSLAFLVRVKISFIYFMLILISFHFYFYIINSSHISR